MPPENIVALRWMGTGNVELAYNGQTILLDTFYDRGPRNRSVGFMPDDVTQADAIFIGHGHWDHMSDATQIARQTGATVYGAKTTTDVLASNGLSEDGYVTVSGGEVFEFDGFKVETILAKHSQLDRTYLQQMMDIINGLVGEADEKARAWEDAVRPKGSSSPDVIDKGTIAYLFTFDTGFTFLFRNTAGPITDEERAIATREGQVDVAALAYQGQIVARKQVPVTLELAQLYKPRVFFPIHHDEIIPVFLDMGTEPLFMAMRESEELKGIETHALLYREPLCLSVEDEPQP